MNAPISALGPVARAGERQQRRLNVSFEFSPPKTPEAEENLWKAIRRLEPLDPSFVSVTYGAGGSTRERTHRTVKRMLDETRLRPAAHLTCVGATRDEVDAVIQDYWDSGIRHIVALRGDPPGSLGGRFLWCVPTRRSTVLCHGSGPKSPRALEQIWFAADRG